MADFLPPVVGRLLGDVTDFTSKMGEARSTMGQTAADAEARSAAMTQAVGRGLVVAGGVATTAGAILTKMGDESQRAGAQLRTAIENAGGSMEEFGPRINAVSNHLINLGIDDEATARALATLTTATQDPTKALDDMGLVADIAAARHISLESAADKVAKGLNGNTRVFKEFGIELSANATAQEREAAMAELGARVHGQAAAQADNFSTKMESLKIRAENVGEAIGSKVGPAITIAGPLMAGMGGIISSGLIPSLISGVGAAATFAGGMIASGLSAAAAAIPVIIAWAPVILAIAAIGAAAYLLYEHWSEVWGFIKDVTGAAWDWIKHHLGLIAEIVLAPIAPLILLVTHFDEAWSFIKNIVGAAWDWLRDTVSSGIGDVVSFVAGLPGRAVDALSSLGGDLVSVGAAALSSLWDSVSNGIGDVVDEVSTLPGRAMDALGDLGGYLWDAGQDLIRGFINGIANMAGAVADAALRVARGAVNAVKNFLGIGSPSRVFHGFGVNIGEGLAGGMGASERQVSGAAGDLASAAVAGFPGVTGGTAVGSLGGVGRGGVTINIHTATGDIPESTMRKFRDQFFSMLNDIPGSQILPAA